MVDFTPKQIRPEEKDDLEERLEGEANAKPPQKEEARAETPDQDLLDIIEKYEGKLAEPSETVSYDKTEGNLYLSGSEATSEYTYEGDDEKSAYIEPDAVASINAQVWAMDEWLRLNDPDDFEFEDPTFKSPKLQQYQQPTEQKMP